MRGERCVCELLAMAIIVGGGGLCLPPVAFGQDVCPSFAEAGAQFAVDLYLQLAPASHSSNPFAPPVPTNTQNVCFSPYGVSWVLDAVLAGATGRTRTEMAGALHLAPFGEQVNSLAQAVKESLEFAPEGDIDLRAAMAVWIQTGLPVLPEYMELLATCYGVATKQADFEHAPQQAVQNINSWASDATQGAIPEVLDSVPKGAALVLASAVHFLGKWATPFSTGSASAPSSAPFYLLFAGPVTVPMMHAVASARYAANGTVEVLALPYLGDRVVFLVFLPAAGWFEDFRAELGGRMVLDLLAVLGPVTADVTLPTFTVQNIWDLNQALQGLGIGTAFTSWAEFGGISPEPLAIDSVLQTARIEVDERGTRAEAVTAVTMISVGIEQERKAPPAIVFRADRPFLFAVWNWETKTILFLGHVVDPR
jgi:serpin B